MKKKNREKCRKGYQNKKWGEKVPSLPTKKDYLLELDGIEIFAQRHMYDAFPAHIGDRDVLMSAYYYCESKIARAIEISRIDDIKGYTAIRDRALMVISQLYTYKRIIKAVLATCGGDDE